MTDKKYPRGGDVVRLAAPWKWGGLKKGAIGIIEGYTDQEYKDAVRIIFNVWSCFRGKSSKYNTSSEFVECSGGPGTIATPVSELKPTNETIQLKVWRWKDIPREAGGEEYFVTVPIWEWSPNY
ncbi:hypothetical protein E308F_29630 [Moorella sp. E308F]|uniref:hypothetical protein n=1 Tax=Moorella sp. E308F TaxID=2572682 RepID=UPI0010FFB17B|nr:hypothetical protein [Moorella sp. E308F]GEA16717.1 hypothetical protein E308F_29630 [Moorella sp. E308F]